MSTTLERESKVRAGAPIEARTEARDWRHIHAELDAHGWAMIEHLLTPGECRALAALYHDGGRFRSHVVMARHGFGRENTSTSPIPCPS
jgi:hypothetical protein